MKQVQIAPKILKFWVSNLKNAGQYASCEMQAFDGVRYNRFEFLHVEDKPIVGEFKDGVWNVSMSEETYQAIVPLFVHTKNGAVSTLHEGMHQFGYNFVNVQDAKMIRFGHEKQLRLREVFFNQNTDGVWRDKNGQFFYNKLNGETLNVFGK